MRADLSSPDRLVRMSFSPPNSLLSKIGRAWGWQMARRVRTGMTGECPALSMRRCWHFQRLMSVPLRAAPRLCRLAENEEIKGGKVRVLGLALPRDRLHLGRHEGTAHSARPADRGKEEWLDAGRSSHDTSFEQVLADLWWVGGSRRRVALRPGATCGLRASPPAPAPVSARTLRQPTVA